jgi:hypothetical protein
MTNQRSKRGRCTSYVLLAAMTVLGGCLERELKPLNPCLVSGVNVEINVDKIDKIDLLFMVDNSISMGEEQAALSREFPRLIDALTKGDRDLDGTQDFSPVTDLHLGVVSSDLGLPGINFFEGCMDSGDDGKLLGAANPMVLGCSSTTFTPPFLTYNAARGDDPNQLATDFSCIATLGTKGCGFEQQLESALKAVWPGDDLKWTFVPDPVTGFGSTGNAGPRFPNGDFIREDSLIAIVLVTDEEDCSSKRLNHFLPDHSPNPNTRCYFEGQRGADSNLFSVQRYIQAFKDLRPDRPNLVVFAGIVGVPERLVTPEAMAAVDFKVPAQVDAFFDNILNDRDMQERIDDNDTPDVIEDDNIIPSCGGGGDANAKAYPPRRIVEVAKGFGANGVIQSICQDDFGPAMSAIINVIANNIDDVCLPRPLVPNSDGLVECSVIWELPLPSEATGEAPMACSDRSFLLPPGEGRSAFGDKGRTVCRVAQLAVVGEDESKMVIPTLNDDILIDQGWYYDDFSSDTQTECRQYKDKQRITFTPMAEPPSGVVVKLECLNETQSLPNTRVDIATDVQQPAVGSACQDVQLRNQQLSGDDACVVLLTQPVNGSVEDRSMFCHIESQVCVKACNTSAECPAAWVCDDRPESMTASGGRSYCTNPTCGSSQD